MGVKTRLQKHMALRAKFKAGHQAVHHQADQAVGQQGTAGAGLCDGCARGDKQSGADGATQGDHRQVARLELAVQVVVLDDRVLMGMWMGHQGRWIVGGAWLD